MNPQTRRIALYAIAAIAIVASVNALAHSYAGLYGWAIHHRLAGWQARSWPAEIDVFLAVGELALYVAYLDGWPARQRVWPWVTTLMGLAVSVAGNVGHIQPLPGQPVLPADRLTAAASPLAAFAGLTVGLLVLRMNRQHPNPGGTPALPGQGNWQHQALEEWAVPPQPAVPMSRDDRCPPGGVTGTRPGDVEESPLLQDAVVICQTAAARGERLSQRALARALRGQGHRFPNQNLHDIAQAIGLGCPAAHRPAVDGYLR